MSIPVQFAQDLWVRKSCVAAGHTLLVYDYILSFDDEVLYIWNSPWTVVKVMFLINRYGNLAGQTFIRLEETGLLTHNSQTFCLGFALITSYFTILSSALIHMIVLMRAEAIWGTRRHVSRILIMGYMGYVLMLMSGMTYGIIGGKSHFWYLDSIEVCVAAMPNYVWLTHVGSFILDTIVFIFTMRSLRIYSREFRCHPSGFLHILVRDTVMLFIVNISSDSLTIASWSAYADDPRYFLSKALSNPLLSIVGQRLILNLKGLQTGTYATRDLSHEVDRQLEAILEVNSSEALDNVSDPENRREANRSGNPSQS